MLVGCGKRDRNAHRLKNNTLACIHIEQGFDNYREKMSDCFSSFVVCVLPEAVVNVNR
jgi:hypothetical protein